MPNISKTSTNDSNSYTLDISYSAYDNELGNVAVRFNLENIYLKKIRQQIQKGGNLVFVIDVSGSMEQGKNNEVLTINSFSKIDAVKKALIAYKDQFKTCKSIKIITFATTVNEIDTDLEHFEQQIENLTPSGHTYYLPVFELLKDSKYKESSVLFLTDGLPLDKNEVIKFFNSTNFHHLFQFITIGVYLDTDSNRTLQGILNKINLAQGVSKKLIEIDNNSKLDLRTEMQEIFKTFIQESSINVSKITATLSHEYYNMTQEKSFVVGAGKQFIFPLPKDFRGTLSIKFDSQIIANNIPIIAPANLSKAKWAENYKPNAEIKEGFTTEFTEIKPQIFLPVTLTIGLITGYLNANFFQSIKDLSSKKINQLTDSIQGKYKTIENWAVNNKLIIIVGLTITSTFGILAYNFPEKFQPTVTIIKNKYVQLKANCEEKYHQFKNFTVENKTILKWLVGVPLIGIISLSLINRFKPGLLTKIMSNADPYLYLESGYKWAQNKIKQCNKINTSFSHLLKDSENELKKLGRDII